MRRAVAGCVIAVSAAAVGCSGSHRVTAHPSTAAVDDEFVRAPTSLTVACHATARAVGYPVPCPTRIPAGLTETGASGPTGCALHIIGAGGAGTCAKSWRGWVVGSSTTPDEHLVITAAPRVLRSDAKVVNGPAWYPAARVRSVAWLTIDGRRTHAVFVPQATNDGSAFTHHVVLIWTVGRHTYGIGFHDVRGIQPTLKLDVELVESIRLVKP